MTARPWALVVIRQAGTANAFAPLLRYLSTRLDCSLKVLAYEPAWLILKRQRIGALRVGKFADARRALSGLEPPRFVLTGTSHQAKDDSLYWKWAGEQGRPALAFIDQWVNYAERFDIHARGAFPTHVLAIDSIAARRIAALSLPRVRVVVTGSPAIDDLRRGHDQERLVPARRRADARLAVFATEPVPGEAAYRRKHGFTDRDALKCVLNALAVHAEQTRCAWQLIVKLHPIDSEQRIGPVLKGMPASPRLRTRIQRGDRLPLLRGADVVFGTRSMLLIESAAVGVPTISVQPRRKTASDLTDRHRGIMLVTTPELPVRAIANALRRPRRAPRRYKPSCSRFLRFLQPMVRR